MSDLFKRCCLLAMLLVSGIATAEFAARDYQEKINREKATFLLTFDQRTTNADYAAGHPKSTLADLDLGIRNHIGFDGSNAFSPEEKEELKFLLKDNLNIREGTLLIWVNCGYKPGENGNVGIFNAVCQDENGQELAMRIYLFKNEAFAVWRSSIPPHGHNDVIHIPASLSGISQGEFFQLGLTWSPEAMRLYVNGELSREKAMPPKFDKASQIVPDGDDSWMGFKTMIYNDRNTLKTVIDDIAVYSYAMTPLQMRNQFQELKKGDRRQTGFDFTLSGVDNLPAGDRLEAALELMKLVPGETLTCLATGPAGYRSGQQIRPDSANPSVFFEHVTLPGEYTVSITRGGETVTKQIVRPEMPFIGSAAGTEKTVPAPFMPIAVDEAAATVNVWNRRYSFADGPFPSGILSGGRELLEHPPQLRIDLGSGPVQIKWTDRKLKKQNDCEALLTGTGTFAGFTLSYTTRIEFDGMTHTAFSVHGKPEIHSMQIAWQVAPGYREYLMTTGLHDKPVFSASWPLSNTGDSQIWLASEQGGFCWEAVSDANWIYRQDDNILRADRTSGKCEIQMINRKTAIPDGAVYDCGIFIATPTRPLTDRIRGLRYQDYGEKMMIWTHGDPVLYFGFRINEELIGRQWKGKRRDVVYATADSLFEDPVYFYFKKYFEAPGDYSYKMRLRKTAVTPEIFGFLYPCRMDSQLFRDYRMWKLEHLLTHPNAKSIVMVYNDLCNTKIASNKLDFVTDSFGRTIRPFDRPARREFFIRELRLCRKYGKPFMLHAQKRYSPSLHGVSDYWYPGEQYYTSIRNGKNGYFYADQVDDKVWDSEFNRGILGNAVVFLPQMAVTPETQQVQYAEAMLAVTLPYDIENSMDLHWPISDEYRNVHRKVWDIYENYGLHEPGVKARRFKEQREIVSSDPRIRITYYKAPGKPYLLVAGNKTGETVTTTVDMSKLSGTSQVWRDEYSGAEFPAHGGKAEITLPPRSFRLLGVKE